MISHSPITDYLRDAYGVTDATIAGGGKHPRCEFTYRDKRFRLTLPSSPSDRNWVDIKKGDVRRLLGQLPEQITATKERRTLDQMTPTAPTIPANGIARNEEARPATSVRTGEATVALYAGDKALSIRIDAALAEDFLAQGSPAELDVSVSFTAPDLWTIRRTEGGQRMRLVGARWELRSGAGATFEKIGAFGATRAIATLVGARIEVRLAAEPVRRAVKASVAPEPVAAPDEPISPPTRELQPDDPRAVLAAIRRIEFATPYRLRRLQDTASWAWVAPTITEEDGR